MNSLYESQGVVRQSGTDNHFKINVFDDCSQVVFVVGRSEVPVGTFDTPEEADQAYDSIVEHAVTVNDAIAMVRERSRMVE